MHFTPCAHTFYVNTSSRFFTWKQQKSPEVVPANRYCSSGFEKHRHVYSRTNVPVAMFSVRHCPVAGSRPHSVSFFAPASAN
jgi:hypothetical protein